MIRSLIFAAAFLALSSQASAGWLTQYATILGGTSPDTTFVQTITGQASNGLSFTNTIDSLTGGAVLGDTRRIVAVGANLMSDTYVRTTTTAPFSVPSYFNGNPVVAVFALEGTATTGAFGVSEALFDTGRMAFYSVTASGSFNRLDPLTWGATDSVLGATLNDPIAVWDLASPDAVSPGTIDGIPDPDGSFNLTAAQMNRSAINANTATNTQGNFLVSETETYTGDTLVGNDFLTVTGPDFFEPSIEGLVIRSDQAVLFGGFSVSLAQLAALNTIAVEIGGLGGNAAGGFATGLGALVATDYNVTGAGNNPAGTGDLRATLGLTMAPVATPEPGSIAVWSLMGLIALPIARRRMRKQATG